MSSPAYLPLFGSDYLADTRHLSTEEHGAYLLLMMAAWRQDDCDLPADDHKLARIVGLSMRKWQAIKDTILEFWTVENGRIYQGRLRKERGYADQKSATNRRAAETRWDKQRIENKQPDQCERISECNAPQPQPHVVIAKAITTSRAMRAKPDAFPCPDGVDQIDWDALKSNRKAKRAALSEGAYRQIVNKLERWHGEGWLPGPIVACAAERGWTTVFETDEMKGQKNARQGNSNDEPTNPYVRAVVANQAARSANGAGQSDCWTEDGQSAAEF